MSKNPYHPRSKWHPVPLFRRITTHWSEREEIGSTWVWWKVWQ
jgi:hypothetical protein